MNILRQINKCSGLLIGNALMRSLFFTVVIIMQLSISPKLVNSIAKLYTDKNRALLEFPDNIFDSISDYFCSESNSYTKSINIDIRFEGNTKENFRIKIEDNGKGIKDIKKVFSSIGNSSKEKDEITNGQFGFGMLSYLCFCERLIIVSKTEENTRAQRIELTSEQFLKEKLSDTEVVVTEGAYVFSSENHNSWTVVTLEDFNDDAYKEINEYTLKAEIETHFEQILSRANLTVKIFTRKNQVLTCKPFDYNRVANRALEIDIRELEYSSNRKKSLKSKIDISDKPIKIRLWLSQNKTIDRRPFLILKGRRIIEISEIKALRTYSKSLIWSHPQMTGYIDATGHLKPLISRNEFESNRESRMVFNAIIKNEEAIKEFVQQGLEINKNTHFKKLEKILNSAVKSLNDNGNSKSSLQHKKGIEKLINEDSNNNSQLVEMFKNKYAKKYLRYQRGSNANGKSSKSCSNPELSEINLNHKVGVNNDYSQTKASSSSTGNLSVRIEDELTPIYDSENQMVRSILSGDTIIIYKKHPLFEGRIDYSRTGVPKITWKLISYLCNEISFHLINIQSSENVICKNILEENIKNYLLLESRISVLVDKNLTELN